METINAAANPAQAQQMINKVMNMVNDDDPTDNPTTEDVPEVAPPLDTVVSLPGGYLDFAGEVSYEAEVRELTGRDEEALSRLSETDKLLQEVLTRGTVRVGDQPVSKEILNNMLSGDRDYMLLHIFIATFGPTLEVGTYCASCDKRVEVELDLNRDVPIRKLDSPFDRVFTMETRRGEVRVELPTGHTQNLMIAAAEKNLAELSTLLLSNTVTQIKGTPVISPSQVLDLSIRDRRKLSEEIIKRNPGPLMQQTNTQCPNCETTLEVPLSLAGLFRF